MGDYAVARKEWLIASEEQMRAQTTAEKTRRAAAKTMADLAKVERELEFRSAVRRAWWPTAQLAAHVGACPRRNCASARHWRRPAACSKRRI